MSESTIEKNLVSMCKDLGWRAVKFTDPKRRGAPDRMILTDIGEVIFVEVKTPAGKLRLDQLMYADDLLDRGLLYFIYRGGGKDACWLKEAVTVAEMYKVDLHLSIKNEIACMSRIKA